MKNRIITLLAAGVLVAAMESMSAVAGEITGYVNPLFGTTTLWDKEDLGYEMSENPIYRTVLTEQGRRPAQGKTRAWGGETYPGAAMPHGMVQASPVTCWGSGTGYQYEDPAIYGFFHTSHGHWGQGHFPTLPVSGEFDPEDYASAYSHKKEVARAGYYQVYLDRYKVNSELTVSLRCAHHRHTFKSGKEKHIMMNLSRTNSVRPGNARWTFEQVDDTTFKGSQNGMYFYAVANQKISGIRTIEGARQLFTLIDFADGDKVVELQIGFSYTDSDKAKLNLEREILGKSFDEVYTEADHAWESALGKIRVTGGTELQKSLFYSGLYRVMQNPNLRSDADVDAANAVYSSNNYWDTYANKLVILQMLEPELVANVIRSDLERAEQRGFLSSGFHGDFVTSFITGSYLRGIRGFDVQKAYHYALNNATRSWVNGRTGGRKYGDEYRKQGWIAENRVANPTVKTEADEAKASVQKTTEYAYSDYSVALLAKELGDMENHDILMSRSKSYRNLFDEATGFLRARWDDGSWVTPYDPGIPYYVYMYRESNGWMSTFFAPHDPEGLIGLYPDKEAFEAKLDGVFSTPFGGYEADNMTGWYGMYCVGNQPSQGISYYYYFIGKPEKAQEKIDTIMNDYYAMGKEGLAYAGMDDEGSLSAWYVMNAMGLYSFSPATPDYLVTVPIFDKVEFTMGGATFTITKKGAGRKMSGISYGGKPLDGYFISHDELLEGKELTITTKE